MKKALAFLSLSLLILLSACNGESIGADSASKRVDYLWVFQQTQSQKSSKDFVDKCEKNNQLVQRDGLTEDELDENNIRVNVPPFDSSVDYNFNWEVVGDKVKVHAECYIEGRIQENAFRIIDFEARYLKKDYELDL